MALPREVEIVVKRLPGPGESEPEDFSLGPTRLNVSVGQLRQRIQALLPSHPPAERQRLLYLGRALANDEETVNQAFAVSRFPEQERYFIHLVVRAEGVTNTNNPIDRPRVPITPIGARNAASAMADPVDAAAVRSPSQPQQQEHDPNVVGPNQNVRREGGFVVHRQTYHFPGVAPAPSPQQPQVVLTGRDTRAPARVPEIFQARRVLNQMGETLTQLEGHLMNADELDQLAFELQQELERLGGTTVPIQGALSLMRDGRQADAERALELSESLRRLHQLIEAANEPPQPFQHPNALFAAPQMGFPPVLMGMPQMPMGFPPMPQRPHVPIPPVMPQLESQPRPTQVQSTPVTAYLLSSPTGPQALLFDPAHGAFTTQQQGTAPTPTTNATTTASATTIQQAQQQNQPAREAAVQAPGGMVGLPQNVAAQPDALGPLQPILGHFWLMFRVLLFAWFVMGGNMGWRRPLAIFVIGVGFWFIRLGLFGQNGVARRWWDDIMAVPGRGQANQAQAQNAGRGADGQREGQNRMPEPHEVAARLLNAQRNAQGGAMRELWVRFQRVFALLLASLWPGIGEAHVRAREEEERRQQEEEVAARRREEEERAKKEKEEAEKSEKASAGQNEKNESSEAVNEAESSKSANAEVHEKKE